MLQPSTFIRGRVAMPAPCPTLPHSPSPLNPSRPRIAPAPAADWLQVPRLLLTLAGLRLQRAWQGSAPMAQRSRRQLAAEWEV